MVLLAAPGASLRSAAAQTATTGPTPEAIEQEVLDNVRRQAVGDHQVEDLNLPESLLRRVADRVIRSSYEQRYRIVVPDSATQPADAAASDRTTPADDSGAMFRRWGPRVIGLGLTLLIIRVALRARRGRVQ